ncbi:FHA domain-containing protein [Clostridium sp. AF23-6LB]|uniref:FHA domain-containing protein n=1 Tax=Clostridium sp. AF23-6LB TaxID=2293005 RepID=UPI000E5279D5|nr:FHA domain-containing protein [Clostridium sp. AF23-6LB]RGG35867.1 FHA domain-containing protein [Clostridium sp. AF23-6LB]
MKKNKVLLTKTGDTYNCRYVLDQTDIIDEKVDKGVSGKFPQIIPCRLEEKDNQREFIYEIGNKVQLTEFLKKEINKKQMLTLLYNLLSGLEAFGMNMISLSYVAKDIQYVFVAPESLNVYFIVAGVDKEITDLNEVRNFVKDVICNAHYFEMDRDNYVARLITFTNKLGTFSVGDMKEFVNQLLIDMGIHIEEEKKKTEKKEEKTANDKVSRIGVMQNNAKMVQPGASARGSVPPMPNRQVPPMPNGQPMPGRPMPMQMGPDGKPMPGRPMPLQMGPDGKPMNGRPMPGRRMQMQMGPEAKPMNGRPMPGRRMQMQMGPEAKPMNGRPMPGRRMQMQMGPEAKPMNGRPMPGRPMPMQMGPDGKPMNGRPMPMQMGPDGKPVNGQPMPGRPMPMPGQPMPMQMGPDGKPMNGQPMPGRPMPMQMGPDGKPIVPPIPNRPAPSMPEKKPEATPVPPMPEKKPEAAPVPPMPEKKPEAAPVPPMPEKKPETAPVPPVEEKKPQVPVPYLLRIATNEKIYINKPEFSIGRSATKADYTVTDNSDVSRIHCIIERKNGVSYIRDNASTNGTFVNGQNIAGQKNVFLTNNAKVSLGDEGFIYFVR